jgi:hypothetical protein
LYIFKILLKNNFNIAKINRIEKYNGSDILSMRANNTSAFNCRFIAGTRRFSKHSYGIAIDINPLQNPLVKNKSFFPKNIKKYYLNRNIYFKGKIDRNSIIYKIFKKFNWQWGGNWRCCKDYQHFEKKIRKSKL